MQDIQVWAQMFFDDGSVSQGVRINADIYDSKERMEDICTQILKSLNRDEGLIVIWGAGDIRVTYRHPTFSLEESSS